MAIERRFPAVEKNISEISADDIRVRVIGKVIDKNADVFVIDDGTGKIKTTFFQPVEGIDLNQQVRIIGKTIPLENDFEIQGETIQKMEKFDLDLFKKIKELGG